MLSGVRIARGPLARLLLRLPRPGSVADSGSASGLLRLRGAAGFRAGGSQGLPMKRVSAAVKSPSIPLPVIQASRCLVGETYALIVASSYGRPSRLVVVRR